MSKIRKYLGRVIDLLPFTIKRPYIYSKRLRVPYYRKLQNITLQKASRKETVSVMFIVSSMAMWKYEEIFTLLSNNDRFRVTVLAYPYFSYSLESKIESVQQVLSHFSNRCSTVIDGFTADIDMSQCLSSVNADIVFYQIPYEGVYSNELEYRYHLDKLIVYIPYGIGTAAGQLFFNTPLHNLAWRVYTSTEIHRKIDEAGMYNRGENVRVVGEGNSKRFRNKKVSYRWKHSGPQVKKLIWAPHYSILEGHALHRTGFIWLHDFMLHLADRYEGKLQVAFKPHPKLKTLMYQHPEWGREKTETYFEAWKTGENTVLEEGDYSDLFATSDALIHDSSSFIGEYMFTEKPVLFTTKNMDLIREECNEFGKICLDLHYHATSEEEIVQFVEEVVFGNTDTLAEKRHIFYSDSLCLSDGKSPGERIYEDIVTSLGMA